MLKIVLNDLKLMSFLVLLQLCNIMFIVIMNKIFTVDVIIAARQALF